MSDLVLLSPVQERALDALAQFRFLTVDLMRRAGVGRDLKNLRAALDVMVRKGWVGRTAEVPFLPGVGRLPHLYWLRQDGAELVGTLTGRKPKAPVRGTVTAVADLPHRLAIIETHLALREWAGAAGVSLDWFRGDYEAGSLALQRATTMPHGEGRYTPDAIAQVTLPDGKARLLVIEVYRGGRANSLDHFRRKLPELRDVARLGSVERHHQTAVTARFMILFTDGEMCRKALDRWPDASDALWERFFVRSMDEMSGDLNASWRRPGGSERSLFANL